MNMSSDGDAIGLWIMKVSNMLCVASDFWCVGILFVLRVEVCVRDEATAQNERHHHQLCIAGLVVTVFGRRRRATLSVFFYLLLRETAMGVLFEPALNRMIRRRGITRNIQRQSRSPANSQLHEQHNFSQSIVRMWGCLSW